MNSHPLVQYERTTFSLRYIAAEEPSPPEEPPEDLLDDVPQEMPSTPFQLTILGFGKYHLRLPSMAAGTLHVLHGFGKVVDDVDVRRFCGPCALVLPARCTIVNLGASTLSAVVDPISAGPSAGLCSVY
jgi:hypothetical protein